MTHAELITECWKKYKELEQSAFAMNHYDLSKIYPCFTAEQWKLFLTDAQVSEWIQSELAFLQTAELNKILSNISTSKSIGQAQLINALSKLKEDVVTKDGPIFIYMYVPLDEQQEHAPNIVKLERDPFLQG